MYSLPRLIYNYNVYDNFCYVHGLFFTAPLKTPGAGEYEYDHDFADNFAPKYSHGLPLPRRPSER